MTRIIFVRHGETIWNNIGKYQGHTDIPLSTVGISQARKTAQRLSKENISTIYSSDLMRAQQTAEIIGLKHNLVINYCKDLREINFGQWEGRTYGEIEGQYPQLLNLWIEDPEKLKIPGGETFGELRERAMKVIDNILLKHHQETVLLVAHGGTISTILCSVLSIDLKNMWQIKQSNSAISIIEFYDKKGIVTLFNDTYHLDVC